MQAIQLCSWRIFPSPYRLLLVCTVSRLTACKCNWDVADTTRVLHGPAQNTSASTSESTANKLVRVSFLTEQTSHHPPVSAFYIACPEKGISARGFDQLSAKFTGTSIRVTPGAHNLGIFINLDKRNEEYQLTHPIAQLGGLIRGSLSVTVADTCFITCPVSRIKVILQYLEEGWLGKNQNRVQGAIYRYDPEKDHITRVKDISEKDMLAKIDGCWYDRIHYTLAGSKVPPPYSSRSISHLSPNNLTLNRTRPSL